MASQVVGFLRSDGELINANGQRIHDPARAVTVYEPPARRAPPPPAAPLPPPAPPRALKLAPMDEVLSCLTRVTFLTRQMTMTDRRRARAFALSALNVLDATTSLEDEDQALFEAALRRQAASRR
jgi:hypothetical protein